MCHVLIIEDEPFVAMDLQELLEHEGATSFDFADTQQDAVAAALLHRPDLITSDVKLLDGTGPLAVEAIYRALGAIPVIFITASPQDCSPCEPSDIILTKPINAREVVLAFNALRS